MLLEAMRVVPGVGGEGGEWKRAPGGAHRVLVMLPCDPHADYMGLFSLWKLTNSYIYDQCTFLYAQVTKKFFRMLSALSTTM